MHRDVLLGPIGCLCITCLLGAVVIGADYREFLQAVLDARAQQWTIQFTGKMQQLRALKLRAFWACTLRQPNIALGGGKIKILHHNP